jgi:RNA-binding protein MEX3
MPASLLYEMEHNVSNGSNINGNSTLEDRRALQLALELSMLGLDNENDSIQQQNFDSDSRNKKSQNTTECVPVPSSEHVAEIVGRQGCKIKALRAKTNTYIKTPVRGEEPVFVVTGRKEDVNAAKREILSAAEHFSQIRAQRKSNLNGSIGGPVPNANVPGQTTIQVRVPYRVVGLVVGPKGATIKRIQQQTNTYIITPSRDKEPVFEVTGLPDNVETARKEIEAHIAIRTGGLIDSTTNGSTDESSSDFSNSPLLNGMENPFAANNTQNGFNSLYKTSSDPFTAFSSSRDNSNNNNNNNNSLISRSTTDIFNFVNGSKMNDIYSLFSGNGFSKSISSGSYDTDEGIGESPTFDSVGSNGSTTTIPSSVWPDFSTQRTYVSTNISSLDRRSSSLESPTNTSNTSNTTPSMI